MELPGVHVVSVNAFCQTDLQRGCPRAHPLKQRVPSTHLPTLFMTLQRFESDNIPYLQRSRQILLSDSSVLSQSEPIHVDFLTWKSSLFLSVF